MSSAEELKRLARSRFTAAAPGYVTAAIFHEGEEVGRMLRLAHLTGRERVLDVATGGGHIALAFAQRATTVVATDLTPGMLAAARRHLEAKGAANVRFAVADAESLPFPGAAFDVVSVRFAPHHFPEPAHFAAEVARVLKRGGRFVMFDNMAPEDGELDSFMNRFEVWRDPSHVRARTMSEWRALLEAAGLQVETADPLVFKPYPYEDWTARMKMPAPARRELAAWLLAAPERPRAYFQVAEESGRLTALAATFGLLSARKPDPAAA